MGNLRGRTCGDDLDAKGVLDMTLGRNEADCSSASFRRRNNVSMVEDIEPETVEEDGGYGLFMAADWMCRSLHVERQCKSKSWLVVSERL